MCRFSPCAPRRAGPRTSCRPSNPPLPANESPDTGLGILRHPWTEVLSLFRANTFFRNFEIQGAADRLLIYGILFVSECLGKIRPTHGVRDATKEVMNTALDLNFSIPGGPGFPFEPGMFYALGFRSSPPPSPVYFTPCNLWADHISFPIDVRSAARPSRRRTATAVT